MKRALLTVALVAALLVQVLHGVPAHAMAELRAMTCCAHCHHGPSHSDAMRCCGVQMRDDTATAPAVPKLGPLAVAGVASAVPVLGRSLPALGTDATSQHERAAPLFLLVRSLRL